MSTSVAKVVDRAVLAQDRAEVVKGADDDPSPEGRPYRPEPAGRRALLVEAERVDAVDDDLAAEDLFELGEQRCVAVPRDGHGDDVGVAAADRLSLLRTSPLVSAASEAAVSAARSADRPPRTTVSPEAASRRARPGPGPGAAQTASELKGCGSFVMGAPCVRGH